MCAELRKHHFITDVRSESAGEDFAVRAQMSLYDPAGVTVHNDANFLPEWNKSKENGSKTVPASLELSIFFIFQILSTKTKIM